MEVIKIFIFTAMISVAIFFAIPIVIHYKQKNMPLDVGGPPQKYDILTFKNGSRLPGYIRSKMLLGMYQKRPVLYVQIHSPFRIENEDNSFQYFDAGSFLISGIDSCLYGCDENFRWNVIREDYDTDDLID